MMILRAIGAKPQALPAIDSPARYEWPILCADCEGGAGPRNVFGQDDWLEYTLTCSRCGRDLPVVSCPG